MNLQYVTYAKHLDVIGDQILSASNIDATRPKNYEEALRAIQNYENSIYSMETIIDEMEKIQPPTIVKSEHLELIEKLKCFMNGMELVNSSVDIVNRAFNIENYIKGLRFIEKSETEIATLTQQVGDILIK